MYKVYGGKVYKVYKEVYTKCRVHDGAKITEGSEKIEKVFHCLI